MPVLPARHSSAGPSHSNGQSAFPQVVQILNRSLLEIAVDQPANPHLPSLGLFLQIFPTSGYETIPRFFTNLSRRCGSVDYYSGTFGLLFYSGTFSLLFGFEYFRLGYRLKGGEYWVG